MAQSQNERWEWNLGLLPFVWTPLPQPTNGEGIPDQLPFALAVDDTQGTLIQVFRPETRAALARVYEKGSQISGLMDESGIGRQYADDYLNFLQSSAVGGDWRGRKILEIGSGTGYLLHRLQQLGATTLGVEPGAHGQTAAARFGVEVIHDFFPSPKVRAHFDLITFFAVLEHVENPVEFLRSLRPFLNNEAYLALAVPNCQPAIETGDVSMLLHEHWSYFTAATLRNTIEAAGYEVVQLNESGFGGSLYCLCRTQAGDKRRQLRDRVADSGNAFKAKVGEMTRRLVRYFAASEQGSVGVFVPQRIINAAALGKISFHGCRFFDDNQHLHGTYFPGIAIAVDSREVLLQNPPLRLLVMSHSFGAKIAGELRPMLPHVRITTCADLLAREA
jgi:2-polyprenyl-3-methyl-5-hydroxy-6-metoxy-1,4-benzoquinol methylase